MTDAGQRRVDHPDAPNGKASKYALVERERRFLLRTRPPGDAVRRVRIEDRYLSGTRLRLRRATDLATGRVERKLAQKVPAADGGPGLITNLYLSEAEYVALAGIPGLMLRKTRSSVPPFGVDEFEGPLAGLVLAEVEFDDADEELAFAAPSRVVSEVTRDERFTGGRLATTSADELRALLAAFGVG
jgi:CYTH domain-containing protein